MMKQTKKALRKGFTLIELLVIVVVMGILAAGVFRLVGTGDDTSAKAQTVRRIQAIANLLEVYHSAMGEYPPASNDDLSFSYVEGKSTDGCGECSLSQQLKEGGKYITLGLCSNFIDKANRLNKEENIKSIINGKLKNNDSSQDGELLREAFPGFSNLEEAAKAEKGNMPYQRVILTWRQLEKDGIVNDGSFECDRMDSSCKLRANIASLKPDGWGNPFRYEIRGGRCEIISNGPDGKANTADDISSVGSKGNMDSNDESIFGD